MVGATKMIARHLVIRFARNMNFKLKYKWKRFLDISKEVITDLSLRSLIVRLSRRKLFIRLSKARTRFGLALPTCSTER